MLQKLITNRRYLAVAASVLFLLVCYLLAFSPTLDAWQTNRRLQSQLLQSSDVTYQPGLLERKSKNLDSLLGRFRSDSLALRGNTISSIALNAVGEKVRLSEVPAEDPSFHTDQYIVERLSFKGDFAALVRALGSLENQRGIGVPRSVLIKTVKKDELSDTQPKLAMEILLEISK